MTQSRFEDLGISKDVLKAVRSVGWSEPTPVQAAAIPVGLEGADLLAQAQTGTGKTGTFGSIILSRTKSGSSDPTSLVLVPTRELASQVSEEMERLSEYSGHVCIPIYGGVNIETQAKQLKKGADAVIATPGRLKDLIERKMIRLDSVEIVVLDEADRMLDMGFAPSVNMILSRITKDRQTMMFSATMPEEVMKMAVKHMYDHKEILVSKDEPTLDLTEQFFVMTNRATDLNRILLLLLCACLLLPLFPGAAAEEHLPCAAELSAGAVFYTGRDLKEAIGTLEKAAVVRVTETDSEAARITCRLAGKPIEAWVNRKDLRLIDPATPTDLRTDDLLLPAVLPPEEEPAPDAVAAEEPDEAEPVNVSGIPVGDRTRQFLANVGSVTFSNTALVWVGRIAETATVGEIKNTYGLECQYSKELTEAEIEEINAEYRAPFVR